VQFIVTASLPQVFRTHRFVLGDDAKQVSRELNGELSLAHREED
jgi:hypothetical protein